MSPGHGVLSLVHIEGTSVRSSMLKKTAIIIDVSQQSHKATSDYWRLQLQLRLHFGVIIRLSIVTSYPTAFATVVAIAANSDAKGLS